MKTYYVDLALLVTDVNSEEEATDVINKFLKAVAMEIPLNVIVDSVGKPDELEFLEGITLL